jgi:hypothetical protein
MRLAVPSRLGSAFLVSMSVPFAMELNEDIDLAAGDDLID